MAVDADASPAEESSGKKGGSMIGLVIIVFAMSAGGALPFLIETVLATKANVADPKRTAPETAEEYAYLAFGETVVNLGDGARNRYLQIQLSLQVNKLDLDMITKSLESNKVPLQDWMLTYLSEKTLEDVSGAAGLNRIRRDILNQFNTVMFPDRYDRIHDIKFTKVAVQ